VTASDPNRQVPMFQGDTLVLLTGEPVDRASLRFAAARAYSDGSAVHVIRVHIDEHACAAMALTPFQYQGLAGSLHPPHEIEDTRGYALDVLAGSGVRDIDVKAAYVTQVDEQFIFDYVKQAGIGVIVAARNCGFKCDGEVCRTVRNSPVPVVSLPIVDDA
jgi:hypothetical protein